MPSNKKKGMTDDMAKRNIAFTISPKLTFGENINDDIKQALSHDPGFSGNIYHLKHEASAPNPYLNIDGFGSIGVPFSTRDAKALVDHAQSLPQPGGNIPDRKIWEVDGRLVKFENEDWIPFLKTSVEDGVWGTLGVSPHHGTLKSELAKIFVEEPGALNPIGNVSQLDDSDVFATMIVQLPSSFTGGELHIHQDSKERVLSLAENPRALSIVILYAGIRHEFAPISSGHRLHLCYHLRTQTPIQIQPTKGSIALTELRHILRKWMDRGYKRSPNPQRLVCILDSKSGIKVKHGNLTITAQPKDKQMVRNLKTVATELGLCFFSGQLGHVESGRSNVGAVDSEWSGDDMMTDDVSMYGHDDTEIYLDKVRDSKGKLLPGALIELEEEDVVPRGLFTHVAADQKEWDRDSGMVRHRYIRHAVLLTTKEGESAVLEEADETYWLAKLDGCKSTQPTAQERKAAELVSEKLLRSYEAERKSWDALTKYAIQWKDLDLWRRIISRSQMSLKNYNMQVFLEAWNLLSWDAVQPVFEQFLDKASLNERQGFADELVKQSPSTDLEKVNVWKSSAFFRPKPAASTNVTSKRKFATANFGRKKARY